MDMDFAETGLSVHRGFFKHSVNVTLAQEVARLNDRALKMLMNPPMIGVPEDLIVVPERENRLSVCRYEYILGVSEAMNAIVNEYLSPLIRSLMEEDVVVFKDKMNAKNPGGGAFAPHQDFAAYRHFGPRFNVTAMVAIDRMTRENGYVQFCSNWRGVSKMLSEYVQESVNGRPLLSHYTGGTRNGDLVDEIQGSLSWSPVEAQPGDVVIFDSFVPHYSDVNNTKWPRRALFFTFNKAKEGIWCEHYYKIKRGDSGNSIFHVSTPTCHNGKRGVRGD